MGGGRVQGSQVGTSGTQGSVYAITPHTEPAISRLFRVCFYSLAYEQEYFLILYHMHVIVCAIVCEFRGRNYFKGGRM